MKPDTKNEKDGGFFSSLFKKEKNSNTASESLKEAVDAYLEESQSSDDLHVVKEETALLSNVLELRELDVTDIMIPRAEIIAVEVSTPVEELLTILMEKQCSRLPVYKETLDEILGTIHIKDILEKMAKKEAFDIKSLTRAAPIVSPAMPILSLVELMKKERRHMVMVVDEYGGIDGLVTIGDIIEEVLGEIDDEYDVEEKSEIVEKPDGSYIVDARTHLEDLENILGDRLIPLLEDEDDIDTLGGLVSTIAGRLPARGEIIDRPDAGVSFKVLDASPRKIKSLQVMLSDFNNSQANDN